MRTELWWVNWREGDHLEDPGVDESIMLEWIFQGWDGEYVLARSGPGYGLVGGCCECGNELSDSIKR